MSQLGLSTQPEDRPTITLAVCARNNEDIIAACLRSILEQSAPPDEIILVDDHSTDATAAVAQSLGVRVITNEGRQLFDGRNTALKHCRTDLLGFTDSDCRLDRDWVQNVLGVMTARDVVGGTGAHPAHPDNRLVGWLYLKWLIMDTHHTGYTGGVAGGNCYFRTEALRRVGGWPSIPYSNAEDVYIAIKLKEAGGRLWFDEQIIAHHYFKSSLPGFFRKTAKAGEAITVMMRLLRWRNPIWWYTLTIPLVALGFILALVITACRPAWGLALIGGLFAASYIFTCWVFKSMTLAAPRWLARWILIWPYGYGIIKGIMRRLDRETTSSSAPDL